MLTMPPNPWRSTSRRLKRRVLISLALFGLGVLDFVWIVEKARLH
jgi:hypothetical protein